MDVLHVSKSIPPFLFLIYEPKVRVSDISPCPRTAPESLYCQANGWFFSTSSVRSCQLNPAISCDSLTLLWNKMTYQLATRGGSSPFTQPARPNLKLKVQGPSSSGSVCIRCPPAIVAGCQTGAGRQRLKRAQQGSIILTTQSGQASAKRTATFRSPPAPFHNEKGVTLAELKGLSFHFSFRGAGTL